MKIRTQAAMPKASRLFTDREEPRAAFWKQYNQLQQEIPGESNVHVLTYYGIGGIGKSRLLKKLMAEMDERLTTPRHIYFDFNLSQERRTVMQALKSKLTEKYQFQFPLFELGSYIYARKVGEAPDSPEVKKLTEKSPFLSLMLSVVETIPVVGVAAKALSLVDQGAAYLRTYLKQHQRELSKIEYLEADELYQQLAYLFAQDMAHNLENADEPLVIFLDTYERLVNEMISVGTPLNNDLWLREENGLVQNIPNVLWVIAGRETLKWERFDADWKDALEQHILGNLSQSDSDQFLTSAGVGGSELRQDLYELTNGTPVYLDLCVDQFLRLSGRGVVPDISMFGGDTYELIERFVRYMDDSQKDIVYVLACMQKWDDELIMDIGGAILPNFSLTTYEKVKDFSFVIQSDDDRYNIHQTVGEVFVANYPVAMLERIAGFVIEYFQKRIQVFNVFAPEYAEALEYIMRFALLRYRENEELLDFYRKHICGYLHELAEAGRFVQADAVFDLFWSRAEMDKSALLYAWALWTQSNLLSFSGDYTQSAEVAAGAAKQFAELLGPDHPDTLNVISTHASRLCNLGQYAQVLPLYRELLHKYEVALGSDEHNTLTVKNELALTLSHLDQHEEARELLEQVLTKRRESLGEDHPDTLAAMINLASALSNLSRYEEACDLEEKVLCSYQKTQGEVHPATLTIMNNHAATLSRLSRREEALAMQEQAVSGFSSLFGDNHPNTLSAMSNQAVTLSAMQRHEEALALQKQILEKRRILLGDAHPDTLDAAWNLSAIVEQSSQPGEPRYRYDYILPRQRIRLGEDHTDSMIANLMYSFHLLIAGKVKEALELLEYYVPMQRSISGDDDKYTVIAIDNLADALYRTGRYEESLDLYRQELEKRDILPEDVDADAVRERIATTLHRLSRHEEALELREQILTDRINAFGADHPKAWAAMEDVANSLEYASRYEEALALREQVLAGWRSTQGVECRGTLKAMGRVAYALDCLSRNEEARVLREQAASGWKKILETDCPNKRSDVSSLAKILYDLNRCEEALEAQRRVVDMCREETREHHDITVLEMRYLDLILNALSMHDEKLKLREQIVEIQQLRMGEDHPDTLQAMNALANAMYDLARYEEARELDEQVLAKQRTVLGEEHPDTLTSAHNLAMTLRKLKRYAEAQALMEVTVEKKRRILGEDHPSTRRSIERLSRILKESGCLEVQQLDQNVKQSEKAVEEGTPS